MITLSRENSRIYIVGDTYSIKSQIKAIGGHWDADRKAWWVGLAKAEAVEKLVESTSAAAATPGERKPEDPHSIRLTGKGTYKGRTYYLGARSQSGKVRCLTLPDADGKFLDFWAEVGMVEVVKTYHPRERRGYRGRVTFEHTTLGGIADFVRREERNRQAGGPVCAACGRSGELVEDLEDGLMKHRGCCDMPM